MSLKRVLKYLNEKKGKTHKSSFYQKKKLILKVKKKN
jgi:hypothetical protein